jgi:hypothetical protein
MTLLHLDPSHLPARLPIFLGLIMTVILVQATRPDLISRPTTVLMTKIHQTVSYSAMDLIQSVLMLKTTQYSYIHHLESR